VKKRKHIISEDDGTQNLHRFK